jgi:hypothetical protein
MCVCKISSQRKSTVIYELLSQRGHRIFIRTTEKDHSFAGVISRVRLTNRSFGFVYSATKWREPHFLLATVVIIKQSSTNIDIDIETEILSID